MKFDATFLQSPTCVFKGNVERRGGDERFRGLRTIGAYDTSRVKTMPTILFVFPTEYRTFANQIYHGLRNGNNQFPGMQAMFGITLAQEAAERVPKFSVENMSLFDAASQYRHTIKEFFATNVKVDFAIVLCSKTQQEESPSPYYAAKATLAAHGVPSQIVTVDLMDNENQLAWSLGNIALQIFVKLGGTPWYVKPSPGGGDIVVGIGRSERTNEQGNISRYVGYTTCYTSGGLFRSVEVFKPQSTYDDYLESLETSVTQAFRHIVAGEQPPRLVLHVPKTFSNEERQRVEKALKSVQQDVAGYVVLRVNEEHPFLLFDLNHQTMAPPSGLSVKMDNKNRVLLLEGRPSMGNIRRSPPAPLWVTLQTANGIEAQLDAMVQQIYELSVANWRGFNAKARPITTYYSKLIANILASSEGNDIVDAIAANSELRSVPWFI
jgi:argonaute-like protein implicated in RNA metabolism and viral defense